MVLANTLAYYDAATITAVKSFIVESTGYSYNFIFLATVKWVYLDRIFIPGRPLLPIYMFVSKTIVYPSQHLLFQVLHSRVPLMAIPPDNKLGWKIDKKETLV